MKPVLLCKYLAVIITVILLSVPAGLNAQQDMPQSQQTQKEDSVSYYVATGQKLAQQGKFADALQSYEHAGKIDAKNKDAILGQMNMYFSMGKIEEGLNVIKTWTEVDPGNADAWKTVADYFSMAGQTETALYAADKLIALQPDSAGNWESKARMLLGSDRAEEAVFACDKAIALDPAARQAWYLKAYALAGIEKFDEAVITCDKAIALFPDDIEAYYTRACIYSRKGDVNNALADLGKTIEMDPSIKERAQEDPDFTPLYSDKNFQSLTGMSAEKAEESALKAAVCSIKEKKYVKKDFTKKITGSWKADRAYIHGENLLGSRNFFFDFGKDGTISIKEPERNWSESGTWKIGEKENTLEWTVSDKNSSFQGRYDFLEEYLILSGQGFVGEFEHICLRLVR